ncbi:MAG: hypothetical protein Q4Q20_02635 [Methanocorpusculum sp.]|nr:hypothetical protein [Methanocorpusculum sp.]
MPPTTINPKMKLSEEDVILRYITPAITETTGWNRNTQVFTEYYITDARIISGDAPPMREKRKKAAHDERIEQILGELMKGLKR